MNAKGISYKKTLRYFVYLIVAAVLVYIVGNILGFYPERKDENNALSSKIVAPLIQDKRHGKPTLESRKENSVREKATGPQDLTQKIETLPLTSLDLVLLGIIKREDGYLEATIEDRQDKTQGLYTVGSIIRGARVVMISGTKVVLRVDGKDQVLEMRAQGAGDAQQSVPLQQETALPTDEPNWDYRSSLGYAEAILKVRLKPFIKGGNQEGFEVKSVLDESPLKAIGLQDSDIIKSINGEPIDSDLDILRIHDAIRNGDFYTISVVRGGELMNLSNQVK
jgi:type II secretion system protein C